MIDDSLRDVEGMLEGTFMNAEEAAGLAESYDHDVAKSKTVEAYNQAKEALEGDFYDKTKESLDGINTFINTLEDYKSGDADDERLGKLVTAANMATSYIREVRGEARNAMVSDVERRRDPDAEESQTDFAQYVETLSDINKGMVEDVVIPGTMKAFAESGNIEGSLGEGVSQDLNDSLQQNLANYEVISEYN